MTKTYEIPGMKECHPEFRAGRGRIRVPFTGGQLCVGGSTAASFSTSDPVLQKVIEASPQFHSGKIRLGEATDQKRPRP